MADAYNVNLLILKLFPKIAEKPALFGFGIITFMFFEGRQAILA